MQNRLVALALGIMLVGGCDRAAEPPSENVQPANTHEMMVEEIEPAAKVYWSAVQYVSDETGYHEILPRNEAEWKRTRDAAEQVKHYAETLQTPAYTLGRGQDWQDFARGLATAAGKAMEAAEAKDVDRVLEAGGTLYNVCSACHEVYLPFAGARPPAVANSTAGS